MPRYTFVNEVNSLASLDNVCLFNFYTSFNFFPTYVRNNAILYGQEETLKDTSISTTGLPDEIQTL